MLTCEVRLVFHRLLFKILGNHYKMSRPECKICSYIQPETSTPVPVYHRHSSSRQERVLQGAEDPNYNRVYFCPTCQTAHLAAMPYGLDICVSDSTLHDFHNPRDPGVVCPPDSSHVDWISIPGATIEDLLYAWKAEYSREVRPMRIILVGGLNDLLRGGSVDSITTEFERFKVNVAKQEERYHPGINNSFAVAPLIPAPKFFWLPDNGPTSPTYVNRRDEITRINEWVQTFNSQNGIDLVPRFHTFGIRTHKKMVEGRKVEFKTHRWNEWRASEAPEDKIHLVDKMRVKMGNYVLKYFQAEREKKGPLV